MLEFASAELVPRLRATTGEIVAVLHALDGGYVPAGPSGSPTRGLVNVLPTGRNFYSVDPKAIPSRTSFRTGLALANSLLARHLADEGEYPRCVGLTVWGTSAMRTQGDDIAEVLALIGCRPQWDDASRRVTGFEIVPLAELGRPRIDVTLRISGFFRDAFPHVIALLDDAIGAVAALSEPPESNYLRAHALADQARHGDWRRATTRIFGSKPGAYGAGLLPLIDAGNWRDDADLAEVYAVWGGYAYGRGLDGVNARPDMEGAFRRIAVAAKNIDTREHDIADSDDYFQYHGGMVAMVRSLTGRNPAAYIGDSAVPDVPKTRTLAEETRRVFRSRVVNPRWIAAMRRHGYKGAFELAATVDYLFGYDATAGVVPDWMYEQLAASYVFDEETRSFMQRANPWALRGITERLLEAASRGLWESPDAKTLDQLRQVYLDMEGDLESRELTPNLSPDPSALSPGPRPLTHTRPSALPAHGRGHPRVRAKRDLPEIVHVDAHRDQRVAAVDLAGDIEIGHGHAGREPPGQLHLNPRRNQAEQFRLRHPGHRADVMHRRAAGLADRPVLLEGRPQQLGAERPQFAHPLQHRRGSPGSQGHVEPEHGDSPAGPEHRRGGLRISPDVVLGGGRDIAPARRPAHDHEFAHPVRQPRLPPHGQRDVGQRAGRHQRDLAGGGARGVDDVVHGVSGGRAGRGRRQGGAAQPRIAVHLPRVERRAQQRPGAARGHRRPGRADELAYRKRVRRRLGQPHVARHGGDADQVDAGVPVRERDRERVIDPGIAVEDDSRGHRTSLALCGARNEGTERSWCVPP